MNEEDSAPITRSLRVSSPVGRSLNFHNFIHMADLCGFHGDGSLMRVVEELEGVSAESVEICLPSTVPPMPGILEEIGLEPINAVNSSSGV
ncbi:hypothetical protein MHYP_G00114140 [Metynnis hypsauchen]